MKTVNLNISIMQKTKSAAAKAKASSRTSRTKANGSELQEFFVEELKDIYWAEKHLTKALPKMQKAASTEELKNAFEDHLAVTEEHVSQLEKIFDMLGKKAQAKKCEAMEGITKEGSSVIEETEKGSYTRDAGLIMSAQKVEHYEIATYGSLVQIAKTLELQDVASILENILQEEKDADVKLSGLAERKINKTASTEMGKDEENE
jgi:ferritin-like metal-binding protein YciE